MARKIQSPVKGLRKILLTAAVVIVLAVVGLVLFGRAGRQREAPAMNEREIKGGKGMALIGEDFDYTFTEGERQIFRIRGESVKADREGTLYLSDVAVTLYDKQNRPFHVESRKASFNRESNEGELQGQVVLKGPDGLELRTQRLDMRKKGNLVISQTPVEIRYQGRYVVNAGRMQMDIADETYILQGGADLKSVPGVVPPVRLQSQRFVYERGKRWIRIEGGARMQKGADWLEARRIFGNLTDDESGLKFVHALWDVSGETRAALEQPGRAPEPTRVRFSGKDLAVVLQPEANQVRRVELDSAAGGKVKMESTAPGTVRTLTARRIEGLLAQGVLTTADAFGGVEINETSRLPGKPPAQRFASGQRGNAGFRPDGQLATVDLANSVVYRDGEVNATGNRASLDMDQGRGEFFGSPVVATTERGRIEAPRLVYNTDTKIVSARGGVKAQLQKVEETALEGTPLSQGEGPVNVHSQEAFWRQEPSSFIFRGDVRAWRGDNLLLAPELRGDRAADVLVASGGVKTRWYPTKEQTAKASVTGGDGKPRKADAGGGPPKPVQVQASEMTYQQKAGDLVYTGNVRVDQEGRSLACQRLQVELGEDREAETMTCTGDTMLRDPKGGRTVSGQRAVYHVDQKQVEIFGEPVTMLDKDGNKVHGQRVLYFMEDGKVEVKGKDETAPVPAPAPAAASPGSGG